MFNNEYYEYDSEEDNSAEGSADIILNLLFFFLLTSFIYGRIWENFNLPDRDLIGYEINNPPSKQYALVVINKDNKIDVWFVQGREKKKIQIFNKKITNSIEIYNVLYKFLKYLKKTVSDFEVVIRGNEEAHFGTVLGVITAAKDLNLEIKVEEEILKKNK